jgi:hypothetical protein
VIETYYYLDFETYGKETSVNPLVAKIITIQYAKLDIRYFPCVHGKLHILKEWDSSEKDILESFKRETHFFEFGKRRFTFCPIGKAITFEQMFLYYRMGHHNVRDFKLYELLNKPWVDLKHCMIMMNGGIFKKYDKLEVNTNRLSGKDIRSLYENLQYEEIEKYVQIEFKDFIATYDNLRVTFENLGHYVR